MPLAPELVPRYFWRLKDRGARSYDREFENILPSPKVVLLGHAGPGMRCACESIGTNFRAEAAAGGAGLSPRPIKGRRTSTDADRRATAGRFQRQRIVWACALRQWRRGASDRTSCGGGARQSPIHSHAREPGRQLCTAGNERPGPEAVNPVSRSRS